MSLPKQRLNNTYLSGFLVLCRSEPVSSEEEEKFRFLLSRERPQESIYKEVSFGFLQAGVLRTKTFASDARLIIHEAFKCLHSPKSVLV